MAGGTPSVSYFTGLITQWKPDGYTLTALRGIGIPATTPVTVWGANGQPSFTTIPTVYVGPIPSSTGCSADPRRTTISTEGATPSTTTVSNLTSIANASGQVYYIPLATPSWPSQLELRNITTTSNGTSVYFSKKYNLNKKSRLSVGAGVGIGFVCAIAAALIAFLVWRFLMAGGKHRSRHSRKRESHDYGGYPLDSKAPVVATVTVESSAAIVEGNLSQPTEDNEIKHQVSRVKQMIDNHVKDYYLQNSGNEKTSAQALAAVVGENFPIASAKLPALLADSRSRSLVLRSVIASIILSRIAPDGDPEDTFLPPDVLAAYGNLGHNKLEEKIRRAFLSKWRVITAMLTSDLFKQDASITPSDPRLTNVQAALQQADSFLAPLANPADQNARLGSLDEIMKRVARLGWTLFSQPSEFAFDWTDRGRLVVFPALMQVTDGNGTAVPGGRLWRDRNNADYKEVAAL